MGRIANGWEITKQSLSVLKKDKEILIYPILSVVATITVAIILGIIMFFGWITNLYVPYLYSAAMLVLSYFISIFFQAAIVTSATIRFSGKNPSLSDGFKGPLKIIPKLLIWASINAIISVILNIISSASKRSKSPVTSAIGQSSKDLFNFAWGLITLFVVPIMLFEKTGPIKSIKESWILFKKTWGENMTAQFSVGAIFFLINIPLLGLITLAVISSNTIFILISLGLLCISIIISLILATSVNGILKAAMYIYAKTGKMPNTYDQETFKKLFVKR